MAMAVGRHPIARRMAAYRRRACTPHGSSARARPRDPIGRLARPGPLNAITDVAGVRVGHRTIVRGDDGDPHAIRTGVTAIFPHEGHPWGERVYAGVHILNGYGELIGVNQIGSGAC